jgi:hypothetical protein
MPYKSSGLTNIKTLRGKIAGINGQKTGIKAVKKRAGVLSRPASYSHILT